MREHMLRLCKMDLLMQRETIKEKRIKTNKEHFSFRVNFPAWTAICQSDPSQHCLFIYLFIFKKGSTMSLSSKREGEGEEN